MNPRKEFKNAMLFRAPEERLPAFEWAKWWEPTIERWTEEGMPAGLDAEGIKDYFGLDKARRIRFRTFGKGMPNTEFGQGVVKNKEEYLAIKKNLFPEEQVRDNLYTLTEMKRLQEEEGMITWAGMDGFFWFPRQLFGIEEHLYAFYDYPDLMHEMNNDLLQYNIFLLDEMVKTLIPDFITISEDMSYNHGPMISREFFDEFIKPYYLKLIPRIKEYGIITLVDSDGDVFELIEWLEDCGVDGIMPLERQAGVDVSEIRKKYPRFLMLGGFDKTIMHKGEEAMRQEFERLLPVMKSGGYVPSVDHQTPPDVSLENYKTYVALLKEYNRKAIER